MWNRLSEAISWEVSLVQISITVAIAELVPNKHRPLWISGIFFSLFEIACFGPVIAHALVTNTAAGWRWSFYFDIIVAGLAVGSVLFLLSSTELSTLA
jgi:MFS family permease